MSIRIRLIGTDTECADAIDALRHQFRIDAVSRPYASRGRPDEIRLYVDASQHEKPTNEGKNP